MRRLFTTLAVLAAITVAAPPAGAADQDVRLSEIMYHPGSDDDAEEFLELRNVGGAAVDLTGWCVDGISFCFEPGASISGGGYLVLAADAAVFAATYGQTPDAVYTGGLKNGGEDISVLDAAANVIDFVDYDDASPWAITPDEGGPSLERIFIGGGANDPWNWAASTAAAGHTVGALNSVDAVSAPPRIENLTALPASPAPGQALVVEADVANATSLPELRWRLDFNTVQTITMASIGGGRYRATIPGQAAGSLVRYRVATTGSFDHRLPRTDDSRSYLGAVVADPALDADLPVFEWFMDDADYDAMLADHREDNVYLPVVIAYDGVVHDGVTVRVRGDSSRDLPKVSLNVVFPQNHLFDMPGLIAGPIDKFALNALAQTARDPITMEAAWRFHDVATDTDRDYVSMHVRKNGEFWGLYGYVEALDDKWRERIGLDDIELYKGGRPWNEGAPIDVRFEKKNPDDLDYTNILDLLDLIENATHDELFDAFDIPQVVNFAAIETLLRNEGGSSKNFYIAVNPDSGRWQFYLWDVNNTFKCSCDLVPPLSNQILAALIADPEFRAMHDRRVRTLIDEYLYTGVWEQWMNEAFALVDSTRALDDAKWGNGTAQDALDELLGRINNKYEPFYIDAPPIPPSASGTTPIVISEIHAAPGGDPDAEFVELTNTSSTEAVELSEWTVTGGIDLTMPRGAVLLPNSSAVLVKDVPTFEVSAASGITILGTFDGSLNDTGELLTISTATGTFVDQVDYSAAGFPALNGSSSLELAALAADNSLGANWQLSANAGGTPGAPNGTIGSPVLDTVLTSPSASPVTGPAVTFTGSASDDTNVLGVVLLVLNEDTGEFLYNDGTTGPFAGPAFLIASLSNDQGTTTDWSYNANLQDGNWRVYSATVGAGFIFDPTGAALSFTVTSNPGPDTENPNATITTPTPFQTITDPTITIEGTATDNIAIDRVAVAIRDRTTNLWLQPNGTYGPWTQLPATLTGGTPTNTTWQFTTTLTPNNYEIVAYTWDTTNNNDPTKARTKFTIN